MIQTLASFSVEKPQILFSALAIFPAILFVIIKFKRIQRAISSQTDGYKSSHSLKFFLILRTAFRCAAWISAVLALSEISFGSKKIPVHKSGSNVFFVFDISYSMLADDAPQKLTRLDAVKIYASSLIGELDSSSFSAVLAKGDGFVAIPETEDKNAMLNLIENLSPKLMTSGGSSLGKGIEAALSAIPAQSAKSQYIFVFTDGDETDNLLEKSLEKAAKFGVPVSLVGFGSENEIEITSGDGKTRVKTALRAKKIGKIVEEVNKSNSSSIFKNSNCRYIDSKTAGSAWQLLNQVKKNSGEEDTTLSYEVQHVNRHAFFIFWAIIFLILSFVSAERFSPRNSRKTAIKRASLLLVNFSLLIFMTSCSSEKKQVLNGVWAWYEGKYTSATANFLKLAQKSEANSIVHKYAVFDLSATYLSMGENEAAFNRLSELNPDNKTLPPEFQSAAYYNTGIILTRKNDYKNAAENFKKAILADSKNLNAKINLELCERELVQKQANSAQAQMQGINEEKQQNPEMSNEIFELIREQEGKKWQNMSESNENKDDVLDY